MLKNLTIKSRLVFVIGFLSLLLIGSGIVGISSLNSANNSLKSIYEDRLIPIGKLNAIARLMAENRMAVAESMNGDPAVVSKKMDDVDRRLGDISKNWDALMAMSLTPEEKSLAQKALESRTKYAAEGLKPTVEALRAANVQQAMELMQGPMSQNYGIFQGHLDALLKVQDDIAKKEYETTQNLYVTVRNISIIAILGGLMLAGFIGMWLVRAISAPLDEAVRIARSVAEGD
jgi:hypothetical protein